MVLNKRSKSSRYRGSTTHGCGSMKKRRGAGNRGGRGMAGSGKRAGHKKSLLSKLHGNSYLGKSGFKRPKKIVRSVRAVNVCYLDSHLDYYLQKNLVSKDGDFFVVDVSKLGFDKVLGKGSISNKIKIKALFVSSSAVKKIESAGGEVIGNKDVMAE